MKKTEFIRKIEKENRKYEIVKLKSLLLWKLSFGEKRKTREFAYSIFREDFRWEREENNALPKDYYYKPTDVLLYDLIPKQNLKETKKGLIRLFRRCLAHKFISAYHSEDDLEKLISGLDQTLHSGNSWYNVGFFDFAYDSELATYIDHFDVHFRNFSSSYVAIEMKITLTEKFCVEIESFMQTQYRKPGMCVHKKWVQNEKLKSGAKIGYAVSGGTMDAYAKSQIIYEQLELVKRLFLKEIKKYFPLMIYDGEKNVLGINIFETNITPDLGLESSIYASLGIDDMYGFNLSIAERLYMLTATIPGNDSYPTNMMYVYNPEKINDFADYGTKHNKMVYKFSRDHMDSLYKMVILKNLGIVYLDIAAKYRNDVNAITAKRSSQKRLLKLKYEMSKAFYDFSKITEELPFEKTVDSIRSRLEKNECAIASVNYGHHPYKYFTERLKWMWSQIQTNHLEIESDLSRKMEISSELTAFSREKSNRKLMVVQLLIAMVTFLLLIFPDKAQSIAKLITTTWSFIRHLFCG